MCNLLSTQLTHNTITQEMCSPIQNDLAQTRKDSTHAHTCRCRLGLVGRHITISFLQLFCLLSIPTLQRRLWMDNIYEHAVWGKEDAEVKHLQLV